MTKRKFNEFWDKWTLAWMETDFYYQGTFLSVSSLCEVDNRTKFSIYKAYMDIKQVVKDSYFYNPVESNKEPTLNRYKRAAVLMYVICNYEPLKYHKDIHIPADPMMLKQRFAFYMATASILQDFRKEDIVPKKNMKLLINWVKMT